MQTMLLIPSLSFHVISWFNLVSREFSQLSTCPSSESCWNDWSASSLWDISRTMICSPIYSHNTEQIIWPRRPWRKLYPKYYQQQILEIWRCSHFLTCQQHVTLSTHGLYYRDYACHMALREGYWLVHVIPEHMSPVSSFSFWWS